MRLLRLMLLFLCAVPVMAQTPTVIQHVACPSSGGLGSGTSGTTHYYCQFAEPTQAGNLLALAMFMDNTSTPSLTVADDKSHTWTQGPNGTTANGNRSSIWYFPNSTAGTFQIKMTIGAGTFGFIQVYLVEVMNVATSSPLDVSNCRNQTTNSTSVTAGSVTPTVSGDYFYQSVFSDDATSSTSFTVGSQTNITWQLEATMLNDGGAAQDGVYASTSALNATFTRGTTDKYISCVAAFKAASAGAAATNPVHIRHLQHDQRPAASANPFKIQMPTVGMTFVSSYTAGSAGGSTAITGITSTPSNTWAGTGTPVVNSSVSQIWYSTSFTASNSFNFSATMSHVGDDGTYMDYDFVGSPLTFDADSGGQSGNQTSLVATLTTCSSCITPTVSTEVVLFNFGQDFCTATSATAPTGVLLDNAFYDGNNLDGPQTVDQNNGWSHFYTSSTSALTATWGETCGATAEGLWAGRAASFKFTGAAGSVIPQVVVIRP